MKLTCCLQNGRFEQNLKIICQSGTRVSSGYLDGNCRFINEAEREKVGREKTKEMWWGGGWLNLGHGPTSIAGNKQLRGRNLQTNKLTT